MSSWTRFPSLRLSYEIARPRQALRFSQASLSSLCVPLTLRAHIFENFSVHVTPCCVPRFTTLSVAMRLHHQHSGLSRTALPWFLHWVSTAMCSTLRLLRPRLSLVQRCIRQQASPPAPLAGQGSHYGSHLPFHPVPLAADCRTLRRTQRSIHPASRHARCAWALVACRQPETLRPQSRQMCF